MARDAKLQATIQAKDNASSVFDKTRKAIENMGKSFKKTQKATESFDAKFMKMSKNFLRYLVIYKAGMAALDGLTAAMKNGINEALDFELALAEVATIADVSDNVIRGFRKEIEKLSIVMGKDATEATKGLYNIISAGVRDPAKAMRVLEISAKAAKGGLTDLETASNALTTIMLANKVPIEELEIVASQLFQTVKMGKLRFAELATGIGIPIQTAKNLGISLDQVLGAVATITKEGGKTASAAFTQINRAMISILSPSPEMVKVFGKINKALGLNVKTGFDLVEHFNGQLLPALQLLRDTTEEYGMDLFKVMRRQEGFAAVLALTGESLKTATDDTNAIKDATNEYNEAVKKIDDTTQVKFNKIKERFKSTLRDMGDALAGFAIAIDEFFKDVDKFVGESGKSITDKIISMHFKTPVVEADKAYRKMKAQTKKFNDDQLAKTRAHWKNQVNLSRIGADKQAAAIMEEANKASPDKSLLKILLAGEKEAEKRLEEDKARLKALDDEITKRAALRKAKKKAQDELDEKADKAKAKRIADAAVVAEKIKQAELKRIRDLNRAQDILDEKKDAIEKRKIREMFATDDPEKIQKAENKANEARMKAEQEYNNKVVSINETTGIKIAELQKKTAKVIHDLKDALNAKLHLMTKEQQEEMHNLLVENFNKLKEIQDTVNQKVESLKERLEGVNQLLGGFASGMESMAGALDGVNDSASKVFDKFAKILSILQQLAQMSSIIHALSSASTFGAKASGIGGILGALGGIGAGMIGLFHQGGAIQKLHSGGVPNKLSSNEVPIIAQTGEYMLSRRAVQNMGGQGAVDQMHQNARAGGGGTGTNVHLNLNFDPDNFRSFITGTAEGRDIVKQAIIGAFPT